MSGKPSHYDELTRLISGMLDGRLSAEENSRLEALLQADSNARQLYMQLIDQEVELSCQVASPLSEQSQGAKAVQMRTHSSRDEQRRRFPLKWALAAAAM